MVYNDHSLIHLDQAPCRLSVVRREELDFSEYWALDGNTEVVCAEYNGNNVVVKKYRSNKKQWVADRDAWLCLGVRPHYLQLIGQSDESACSLHLVFRDPGVPVQTYIERGCRDSVKKCTMDVLTMVIQFAGAAIGLLHKDHGGCKIDTANICLRSMGGNALKGLNFVIADFDPSRVYGPTDNDPKIDSDAWDIFVNLITKAITGKLTRPNYVVGDHGETGPTVTRVFRFLIHFLVDFPYREDRQHDALDQKFKKLTSNMRTVQDDVERFDPPQNRNPLLDCMQPYYSDLCAIWDLWHVLPVAPGDLGIMVPGDDSKRPVFQKIANIAGEMNVWLSEQGNTPLVATNYPAEYAEQRYDPPGGDPAFWSSEVMDTFTIR
ncbi:hypothetical protein DFH06DRAFT_1198767 [Mycena polygramma]|nr:hypothetical protein DFH06DRAFT_1198767 [Mycena polygramma]